MLSSDEIRTGASEAADIVTSSQPELEQICRMTRPFANGAAVPAAGQQAFAWYNVRTHKTEHPSPGAQLPSSFQWLLLTALWLT